MNDTSSLAGSPVSPTPATVEAWLPLVRRVARTVARRLPSHIDAEELVGAGTVGLIEALGRYDAARCDRFAGYAEIRIRGAMLDQLREMDWMPRAARRASRRLDDATSKVGHQLGAAPAAGDIAAALGVSVEDYERLRREVYQASVVHDVDLDQARDRRGNAEAAIEERQLRERLTAAIAGLSTRQQQLLSLYYVDGLKLREIGDIFGVTESRVCQLLRGVVEALRSVITDD